MLQLTGIPDQGPLSIGPLLKGSGDGSTLVLYSTAGANGSLFMASLKDIASGRKDLVLKMDSPLSASRQSNTSFGFGCADAFSFFFRSDKHLTSFFLGPDSIEQRQPN